MTEKLLKALRLSERENYRPLPFWSWNGNLEADELKRQIEWMCDKGFGGFFMHARSGLQTEYLSEKWFDCIKLCCDEAKKRNMQAWAYDENGWPSGFAGGKLLADEKNRDCYILHSVGELDPNASVSYIIDTDELVRVSAGEASAGREYLNLKIKTAVSTTDILNPDVVDRFLNETHQKYKENFGGNLGGGICGFFTDEPQYQRWHIPYTHMLEGYFKEHYGEDVFDGLGLLFLKKNGYRRFRYRYWKAMQQLMLENFAKKIYLWCENAGVQLTGHFVQEDTIGYQMTGCAGVMPFYEYEHIPGIDCLGRGSENSLPSRQVYSAAAQTGKKRILTESFGCCGWDISPEELGRILGFQFVNGVNLLCHHLIPYAENGSRKRDFPAHYSPFNPWVEDGLSEFNTAFTNLGYLLGESEERVNVAVLHPLRSAYFDYDRERENDGFGIEPLENSLRELCQTLEKRNIAYHFLDETLLSQLGFAENGRIGCGKRKYEYLIIPPIQTMDKTTEEIIRKFAESGGKMLLAGSKPEYLEAESYDYSYLKSNCSLDEITSGQPYSVKNQNTELFSTMRFFKDFSFLFVQNGSATEQYEQTFDFGGKYHSFDRIDPVSLKIKNVPLKISLDKNEFALLVPSEKKIITAQEPQTVDLYFSGAAVDFKENYLVMDKPCVSKDGINFSEPRFVYEIFNSVTEERYEGKLFLRYDFDVEAVPDTVFLRAEECSVGNTSLNGKKLVFEEEKGWNKHFYRADIGKLVKKGANCCLVELDWKWNESVHYALFGEGVTESLKNSLIFENEIEPVVICGKFGVYSEKGFSKSCNRSFLRSDGFYIGKIPETVTEPITDGFPFFAGKLRFSKTFVFENTDISLNIPGNFQMAFLRINGKDTEKLIFGRKLDASGLIMRGENLIEAEITVGNRNLLGPHHYTGDKYEDISPEKFELTGDLLGKWINGENKYYHPDYDLLRLYTEDISENQVTLNLAEKYAFRAV